MLDKHGKNHEKNVETIYPLFCSNSAVHYSCSTKLYGYFSKKRIKSFETKADNYNKKQKSYYWEEQSDGYYMLPEKAEWIEENKLTSELRKIYLDKKNYNPDQKHSRTLYAEAVHEVCQKYGYYD